MPANANPSITGWLTHRPTRSGDFMRDFGDRLVPLLEDGVRVMIYAGGGVGGE
jgi:hypothetical protein